MAADLHRAPRAALFLLLFAWLSADLVAQSPAGTVRSLAYGETTALGSTNPYGTVSRNGATDRVLSMLYEPLYRFNFSDERWENVLAADLEPERVRPRSGAAAFAIPLREAHWHDGTPFTARDVVHTYNYIRSVAANAKLRSLYRNLLADIRSDGANRVIIEFRHPVADPRYHLTNWIIPAAKFTQEFAPISEGQDLNRRPVGTGPYRFDRWSGGYPVLTVNEQYHGDRGNIGTIAGRRITDETTLIASLDSRRGNLNLIVEVPPEFLPRLEADGGRTQVRQVESFNVYAVALRQRPGSVLENQAVRRALTMAVNRAQLLETWFGGHGSVLASPVVPSAPFYDSNVQQIPYDPDQARQSLQRAGAGGSRLRFIYPRAELGLERHIHQAVTSIKEDLEAAGLSVELAPLEIRDYEESLFRRGDFDLAWVRWEFNPAYDISPFFHSSERGSGGFNYMNFSDPDVDRALEDYANQLDPNLRRSRMYSLQRMLNEKAPAIFLLNEQKSYAYHSRYVIPPGTVDPFYFFTYVGKWSILQ